MYMPQRTKLDSWSTDNCCVKWSLKCGSIFISLLSVIWCSLIAAWFFWMTVDCWGVDLRNCTHIPDPERNMFAVLLTKNCTKNNSCNADKNCTNDKACNATIQEIVDVPFEVDVLLCILGIFFTLYFVLSLCVLLGVFMKKPLLLSGWVQFTLVQMALLFTDLLVTLAFSTLLHLTVNVSLFVASLYMWAVVRSHMIALRQEKNRIPLPENAIREFTVEGMDLSTLAKQDEDS